MRLQPPVPRGSTPRKTVSRRRASTRPRNSKVTVSYADPRVKEEKTLLPPLSSEMQEVYRSHGITEHSDAVLLYRGGVLPHQMSEWNRAGVKLTGYSRMVLLTQNGVVPQNLIDYPPMADLDLALLIRAGVSADTAHIYGHEIGLCCDRPYVLQGSIMMGTSLTLVPSYLSSNVWRQLPVWVQANANPTYVKDLYVKLRGDVAGVSTMLAYRASIRLLDTVRIDKVRVKWKEWVDAADGHVSVAKAVCDNGGSLGQVRAWLETGESPARIALLARAGVKPDTLGKHPVADLSDEDLEVWALLTEMS